MDDIVFVLGMGRSGTSALARTLSLCGGTLPERLMPANYGNPKGYWEPSDAVELNSHFLSDRGSSWFDPTLRLGNVASPEASETFVTAIAAFLTSAPYGPLIVKEPRISALAELWFAAAARAAKNVTCVVSVRDAGAVAASLNRRDAMPHDVGQVLWLKYNLMAERSSRGRVRTFVRYDALLRDWPGEVRKIARELGIDFTLERSHEVDIFLEPRERDPATDARPLPWVAAVYDRLARAANEEPLDIALLDAAFDAFRSASQSVDVRDMPAAAERASPDWDTKASWEDVATRIAAALRSP